MVLGVAGVAVIGLLLALAARSVRLHEVEHKVPGRYRVYLRELARKLPRVQGDRSMEMEFAAAVAGFESAGLQPAFIPRKLVGAPADWLPYGGLWETDELARMASTLAAELLDRRRKDVWFRGSGGPSFAEHAFGSIPVGVTEAGWLAGRPADPRLKYHQGPTRMESVWDDEGIQGPGAFQASIVWRLAEAAAADGPLSQELVVSAIRAAFVVSRPLGSWMTARWVIVNGG